MPFHRRRFDVQPRNPAAVMLASDGRQDYSPRAVARAAALAGDGPVAVVTIAKIYGSSFGLPIARELAHALGGRLELESTVGEGSRFTLALPAALTAARTPVA